MEINEGEEIFLDLSRCQTSTSFEVAVPDAPVSHRSNFYLSGSMVLVVEKAEVNHPLDIILEADLKQSRIIAFKIVLFFRFLPA
ncbi:hypothetical protein [Microcoleus sp. bin38.metabat.b11b12b14.051]|uniref:hypothetical protein n=1 Tax=Microcoleus sp. bin38.metabat.b11b12b14.051 TaxID=2742709 RepID=UPI0025FF2B44|nr:hypothetical protein [Microcoleus sp. bin38.metabat.b11b12b14.051]